MVAKDVVIRGIAGDPLRVSELSLDSIWDEFTVSFLDYVYFFPPLINTSIIYRGCSIIILSQDILVKIVVNVLGPRLIEYLCGSRFNGLKVLSYIRPIASL